MSISTNSLSHTRFGLGFRKGDPRELSAQDLLDQVNGELRWQSRPKFKYRQNLIVSYRALGRMERQKGSNMESLAASKTKIRDLVEQDFRVLIARQVVSKDGFFERLANFWADHFTVSARGRILRVFQSSFVDEAIRPHITGRFADLLGAAITHPAMLQYLDQNNSVGPNSKVGLRKGLGLNENLAREMLELHTLGVGSGYSQVDVTALANVLTGLRITEKGLEFLPRYGEPGLHEVLGRTYGGDRPSLAHILEAVEDLSVHPETARHLAQKLVVHFVSDTPDQELVAHVSEAYLAQGGDLKAAYQALLEHPKAWISEQTKVKQPLDYMISSLRAFGVKKTEIVDLERNKLRNWIMGPLVSMGQPPNMPRGPDGWPEEGSYWITPATLSARIEWATKLAREYGQDIDPRNFLELALGDTASQNTEFLVGGSESKWEGVALVLSSPEFNRR